MALKFENFLNEQRQITRWPSKHAAKYAVLCYLARKFEFGHDYTEREVNDILLSHHTFGDYFILRRSLIEGGWLLRTKNGAKYWKNPQQPEGSPLLDAYFNRQ